MASKSLGVLFLAIFFLASPLLQVVRSHSDAEAEVAGAAEEVTDIGIVGEDTHDFGDGNFNPASGVNTVCVFPKNGALVPAGEETDLLVGMKNDGESSINVIAIKASVHLSFDHQFLVQNLTAQHSDNCLSVEFSEFTAVWILFAFNNATVLPSAHATFLYIFAVSKYLQPGNFDLVGTIIYEIDQHPYQSVFYNGTVEVVESGGFLSMESVFLVTLGVALLVLFGLWVQGQIQNLSKKTKRAPKVEVGTATGGTLLDEWLEGTAYSQSQSSKSKKKK